MLLPIIIIIIIIIIVTIKCLFFNYIINFNFYFKYLYVYIIIINIYENKKNIVYIFEKKLKFKQPIKNMQVSDFQYVYTTAVRLK
jgi:hypothetical protein